MPPPVRRESRIADEMSCPHRVSTGSLGRDAPLADCRGKETATRRGSGLLLIGDDRAEEHHDTEVMDPAGKVLIRARLPAGAAGIAKLHSIIGGLFGENVEPEVVVGILYDEATAWPAETGQSTQLPLPLDI